MDKKLEKELDLLLRAGTYYEHIIEEHYQSSLQYKTLEEKAQAYHQEKESFHKAIRSRMQIAFPELLTADGPLDLERIWSDFVDATRQKQQEEMMKNGD